MSDAIEGLEDIRTTRTIPSEGSILMSCDGAYSSATKKGGWGCYLGNDENGKEMFISGTIDGGTNNIAEYTGLIKTLEYIVAKGIKDPITIMMDSQLVVFQMDGSYRVKNEGLKPYHAKAKALHSCCYDVKIIWVPRTEPIMKRIDSLAKEKSGSVYP